MAVSTWAFILLVPAVIAWLVGLNKDTYSDDGWFFLCAVGFVTALGCLGFGLGFKMYEGDASHMVNSMKENGYKTVEVLDQSEDLVSLNERALCKIYKDRQGNWSLVNFARDCDTPRNNESVEELYERIANPAKEPRGTTGEEFNELMDAPQ